MIKLISLFTALLLCVCLATPALAEGFVPSVGEKNAPTVVVAETIDEGDDVLRENSEDCLIVTSLEAVLAGAVAVNDHHSDNFDLLVELYNKIKNGEMKLPYEKFNANLDPAKMVIRDFFDVTLICTENEGDEIDCEPNAEKNCAELLEPKGIRLRVTFDTGLSADATPYVMSYKGGDWQVIPSVNNGDGTVTAIFEDLCPVAISVYEGTDSNSPNTGDTSDIVLWVVLLAVSAAGLVALLVFKRKKTN